eukprot:CAMPEP_0204345124 /NCGR_PEP_ID=MMETSP0469-20131031/26152_1 /ASSEMBLY_ACC=CAM_ASM_000384 /TAXON_ID=2969 /ORGANISM="Oxyrrhis marina" /LENGTH=39 /DNA_ID= /DNA_START= /DNA_END= /DNA_ORIENTATION=
MEEIITAPSAGFEASSLAAPGKKTKTGPPTTAEPMRHPP